MSTSALDHVMKCFKGLAYRSNPAELMSRQQGSRQGLSFS